MVAASLFASSFLLPRRTHAEDLKVSLPFIPPLVESKDKGILIDLLKAMAEEYKDGKITWEFSFLRDPWRMWKREGLISTCPVR